MVKTELVTNTNQAPKLTNIELIKEMLEDYELENCQRRYSGRIRIEDIMNMLELLKDTGMHK